MRPVSAPAESLSPIPNPRAAARRGNPTRRWRMQRIRRCGAQSYRLPLRTDQRLGNQRSALPTLPDAVLTGPREAAAKSRTRRHSRASPIQGCRVTSGGTSPTVPLTMPLTMPLTWGCQLLGLLGLLGLRWLPGGGWCSSESPVLSALSSAFDVRGLPRCGSRHPAGHGDGHPGITKVTQLSDNRLGGVAENVAVRRT